GQMAIACADRLRTIDSSAICFAWGFRSSAMAGLCHGAGRPAPRTRPPGRVRPRRVRPAHRPSLRLERETFADLFPDLGDVGAALRLRIARRAKRIEELRFAQGRQRATGPDGADPRDVP